MKKIFASLILCVSSITYAETNMLPVECGTQKQLATTLTEYGETPFAVAETKRTLNGKEQSFVVLFFLNMDTKTWSVAEKIKNDYYCLITGGEEFHLLPPKKADKSL
jgi:hypothetical protein